MMAAYTLINKHLGENTHADTKIHIQLFLILICGPASMSATEAIQIIRWLHSISHFYPNGDVQRMPQLASQLLAYVHDQRL